MNVKNDILRAIAVFSVLLLTLTACGSDSEATEVAEPTTTVASTTAAPTTSAAVQADEPVADEPEVEEEHVALADSGPAEFVPDAEVLEEQFVPTEAGTYRVDTIGTPFSFTSEELLMVQPNADAFFVLAHVSNMGPDDRDLVFQRISNFALPTNVTGTTEEQGDGWPADDINGWLDALDADVEVSNRAETTLGGYDAVYFEATLADGFECGEEFCAGVATNRLVSSLAFYPGASYRAWVVDQGDESPILVHAAISRESQADWFDSVDAVLATLAFDDPAPNPIPAEGDLWTLGLTTEVPAGRVEIPALGGISFELAESSFVVQNQDEHHFVAMDAPADSELLLVDRDVDENPISTIDELIEAVSGSTTVTELEPSTLGGFPARVFDIEDESQTFRPQLLPVNGVSGQSGWSSPVAGRLWLAETDRGLVMITAEIFEPGADLAEVIEQSQLIVDTLEFIDLE